MAVTVTVDQLRGALRMGDSDLEEAEATRLLATASELVVKFAPGAPDAVANEAVIRCAGYLFDVPFGGAKMVQNPLRLSGASAILARYRRLRAGLITSKTVDPVWWGGWRFDDEPVTEADLVVRSVEGVLEIPAIEGETRTRWLWVTGPFDQGEIKNPGRWFLVKTSQLLEVAGAPHRVWRSCERVPSSSISLFRFECSDG